MLAADKIKKWKRNAEQLQDHEPGFRGKGSGKRLKIAEEAKREGQLCFPCKRMDMLGEVSRIEAKVSFYFKNYFFLSPT